MTKWKTTKIRAWSASHTVTKVIFCFATAATILRTSFVLVLTLYREDRGFATPARKILKSLHKTIARQQQAPTAADEFVGPFVKWAGSVRGAQSLTVYISTSTFLLTRKRTLQPQSAPLQQNEERSENGADASTWLLARALRHAFAILQTSCDILSLHGLRSLNLKRTSAHGAHLKEPDDLKKARQMRTIDHEAAAESENRGHTRLARLHHHQQSAN